MNFGVVGAKVDTSLYTSVLLKHERGRGIQRCEGSQHYITPRFLARNCEKAARIFGPWISCRIHFPVGNGRALASSSIFPPLILLEPAEQKADANNFVPLARIKISWQNSQKCITFSNLHPSYLRRQLSHLFSSPPHNIDATHFSSIFHPIQPFSLMEKEEWNEFATGRKFWMRGKQVCPSGVNKKKQESLVRGALRHLHLLFVFAESMKQEKLCLQESQKD